MPPAAKHVWAAMLLGAPLYSQTTQGVISGRVLDRRTNLPVASAMLTCTGAGIVAQAVSDSGGYYTLPLLSPGEYRLTAGRGDYQAHSVPVDLPVASRLNIDFDLRPLRDVWSAESMRYTYTFNNRIVGFYTTDVASVQPAEVNLAGPESSSLHTSQSYLIDQRMLEPLLLAGRDAYAMLAYLPGVTAQNAASRGLGLSVNGQRPSSSNFLLDGLEINNYLITGHLLPIVPETLLEYRVSTSNFSAEYGRTSGFLANAVTRPGGAQWHGRAYYYLGNEALDANTFRRNLDGLGRLPLKETQPGFSAAGPLPWGSLSGSIAFEYLRVRIGNDPTAVQLTTGPTSFAPVDALDRYLALPRLDWTPRGHRVTLRVALARARQPDFIRSPYPEFSSPLKQDTTTPALIWTATSGARLAHEARLGWTFDDLRFDRAQAHIPVFAATPPLVLPGSPSFYAYRNRNRSWEWSDNLMLITGSHTVKFGGGILARSVDGHFTAGRDPIEFFSSLEDFTAGRVSLKLIGVDRLSGQPYKAPGQRYRQTSFFLFAQDSWRVNQRLFLNYGIRYDSFGPPRNVGPAKDALIRLGPGDTVAARMTSGASVIEAPLEGDQRLHDPDRNDAAGRAGFSFKVRHDGRTLVRGSAGVYYDRPFDNLWQTLRTNLLKLELEVPGSPVAIPVMQFPILTVFQPGLRTPYVIAWFSGLEQRIGESTSVEVDVLGSRGRKLLTTDVVNRQLSVISRSGNPFGRFDPDFDDLHYRANQGNASYRALNVVARRRTSRGLLQASYTWSSSYDNQSEPLAGDFFDLRLTQGFPAVGSSGLAAFSRQFDSSVDWGYSDFDQRHNFVCFSTWDLPGILRGWTISQLAAFRSGFPFTVRAPDGSVTGAPLRNNRADLIAPGQAYQDIPAPGGRLLLNAAAFRAPAEGQLGNTRRNQFRGPGIISVDVSASRTFRLAENAGVKLRVEAFNVLNHANLDNPQSDIGLDNFGLALYGRIGRGPGLFSIAPQGRVLTLAPFTESARQVRILLSLEF
jgi:hypothetical protein